jgi:hypothetical protein
MPEALGPKVAEERNMDQGNWVEVIDREGWCQDFPLQKAIVYIGSDARNDVVLPPARGTGVAARHLQLVASAGEPATYRAVNLASTEIGVGEAGDGVLRPRDATNVRNGEHLLVGEYRLIFHLLAGAVGLFEPRSGPRAHTALQGDARTGSGAIGLTLALEQSKLDPECPLEGTLTVQNLGNMPGVQFKLELEGLEPDWYELGPGPILFPKVEKGVHLRLTHPRGPGIPAGEHEIRIRATAPDAYPGQTATVSKKIDILPYYDHSLRLYAED